MADNKKKKITKQFNFNVSKTKYPGTNEIIVYLKRYPEILYYNY